MHTFSVFGRVNSVVCFAFVVCLFWMMVEFQTSSCDQTSTLPTELNEKMASVGKEDVKADCCTVTPTDIQLTRHSTKSGFHRDVHTSLSVFLDPRHRCTTCRLLIVESLPNGLFVDLYQAEAAAQFGSPQIVAFEDIDLEKPAYLSRAHTILVYPPKVSHMGNVHPSSPSHLHDDGVVNFTSAMTVHLRYHRPSAHPETQSARVVLPAPYLLMRCREVSSGRSSTDKTGGKTTLQLYKAPCDGTGKTLCNWQLLPLTNRESKELHFDVPVGQTNHTFVVATVTILATVVSMVILLVAMSRSSGKSKPD